MKISGEGKRHCCEYETDHECNKRLCEEKRVTYLLFSDRTALAIKWRVFNIFAKTMFKTRPSTSSLSERVEDHESPRYAT